MKVHPQCPFCAIVRDEAPADVVRRWDDAIALTPLQPATVGHTLVVPVAHMETLWDLDAHSAEGLIRRVLEVSVGLREVVDMAGLNIIQSNGFAATQTVPHLHVHVVPRYKDDAMGDIWPTGETVRRSDARRVARALGLVLA